MRKHEKEESGETKVKKREDQGKVRYVNGTKN